MDTALKGGTDMQGTRLSLKVPSNPSHTTCQHVYQALIWSQTMLRKWSKNKMLHGWYLFPHRGRGTDTLSTSHLPLLWQRSMDWFVPCPCMASGQLSLMCFSKIAGKWKRLQTAQFFWPVLKPCVQSHPTRTQRTAKRGRSEWVF